MVRAVSAIWTVNARPTLHKTTMNIAADRTAVIAPVANSTGASVEPTPLPFRLSAAYDPRNKPRTGESS